MKSAKMITIEMWFIEFQRAEINIIDLLISWFREQTNFPIFLSTSVFVHTFILLSFSGIWKLLIWRAALCFPHPKEVSEVMQKQNTFSNEIQSTYRSFPTQTQWEHADSCQHRWNLQRQLDSRSSRPLYNPRHHWWHWNRYVKVNVC